MSQNNQPDLNDLLKTGPFKTLLILGLVIVFFFFFKPWVQVGAGERGVVLNFGAVQDVVLDEGIHFRVPIMQQIELVDVQINKIVTDAASASKDLQDVAISVALNYHIEQDKANVVYQSIGKEFKSRIIDPAVQEVAKAVTARYTAEELITKRPAVSTAMQNGLTERLLKYNMIVDAFSIVSFSFSDLFTAAIEAKQTAEQNALKAERDLDRIKVEAEQKITNATAEAEALRLQKMNISPDLIKLRQIEAEIKAIEKWDGKLPNVTGNGAVPFIGVGGQN